MTTTTTTKARKPTKLVVPEPVLTTSKMTPTQKLDALNAVATVAKASDAYASAPTIAPLLTSWTAAGADITASLARTKTLQASLAGEANTLLSLLRTYDVAKDAYLLGVGQVAKGDPAVIHALGLATPGTRPTPAGVTVPLGITVREVKATRQTVLAWTPTRGHPAFLVAWCADPTAEANRKQLAAVARNTCPLPVLATGTRCYFRVAMVRGAAQSAWSTPVAYEAPVVAATPPPAVSSPAAVGAATVTPALTIPQTQHVP